MKEVEISRVKLRITEEATKNRILEEELQNKNKELHRVKEYMKITQHAKRTVEENEVHGQKQQNCSEQVRRGEVQLDRVVGRGAYGEVWKGKLRGIKVAVKKPRQNSSECRNLFEQEVTIMFQLRHPNVVKCIGKIDDDDGLPCIVLEYADGTLGELLKERPLTHLEVFSFGLDAGRGLLYLHTRRPVPILHRDLHPGNLLFFLIAKLPGRMLKLCDFGTANFLRKTMTPDQGTPWLNAPEAKTQHYTTKVREMFLLQSCFYCKAIFTFCWCDC